MYSIACICYKSVLQWYYELRQEENHKYFSTCCLMICFIYLWVFSAFLPDGGGQQCYSAVVYVAVDVHNPLQKNEHCKREDIATVLVVCWCPYSVQLATAV